MTVAIAFVLLGSIPSAGPGPSSVDALPSDRLLTFRTDASPGEIAAVGARVFESYPAFSIAIGTDRSIALLGQMGRYAVARAGDSILDLLGGPLT
ncbi:MAG: hypothetical protein ACREDF_11860, partial [Thermoplasmata archaeon]